ncbi:GNAT family N-acetyltransferase [Bacteroides congonensis]|jgi:GNAT superfamily N-acetyltransferase|uniref:GNAT family N-acetyltransferase n=1 Tax=Bacteroides congonensis TaxID=1871006 RepID=UPI0003403279|nr:GNAT family N-acetyltransferase [Bacteroides congonensis]CDA84841.1 gCN5-related N-acetyltransferase [Bacteroides sp. CAG:754]
MAIENYDFIPLKVDTKIKPFKCKDSDLNGFLFDDAQKYLTELMAVTYLLEDLPQSKTVAYFSLLNDKITFDPEQRSIWNKLSRRVANPKRRKHYPAVKIGRLAISEEFASQGLGRDIIRLIKFMFTHDNRTGCRFITVDAYQNAVGFYQRCGFDFISEKDQNDVTRSMFYDLKRFQDE